MVSVVQVSPTKACSASLLGEFGHNHSREKALRNLFDALEKKHAPSASIDSSDVVNIRHMSVVTAMTLTNASTGGFWDQTAYEEIFREVGMVPHGPYYNEKNGTSPIFWVGNAVEFDRKIRELCEKEVLCK